MSKRLFREIIIWKEINDGKIARYRCFHVLPDDKYFVKAKDFFYDSIDETQLNKIDLYSLNSLFRGGLNMDDEFYDSLEEAIEKFEKDFE